MTLQLRTRLGAGFAASIGALLALLFILFVAFDQTREEHTRVTLHLVPLSEVTNHLLADLEQMENAEFLYFLVGADRRPQIAAFDSAAASFEEWVVRTEAFATRPAERQAITAIHRHYRALVLTDGRMRELVAAGRGEQARRLNLTESLEQASLLRSEIRAFREQIHQRVMGAIAATEGTRRLAELASLVVLALGIAIAAALWRKTSHEVVEPLRALRAATAAIAEGRYVAAAHPAAAGTVELAALQQDFNLMSSRLAETTLGLVEAKASLEAQVAERTEALSAANRQLEALVEELRGLDKMKSDLLAVVSHELLTPINFVTGFGSALADGTLGPLSQPQDDAVARILAGAERLRRMVNHMLDYTLLESNRLLLTPVALDYAATARDTIESIRAVAAEREVTVETAIDPELPLARADPDRASQVLYELLDNAIKFSARGGRVSVRVQPEDGAIATEIADRGIGIDERSLPRVFSPFFQGDLTSTREYGGMGLGLAIARKLLALMGGSILVQSRVGRGTRFRFTLPRARPELAPQVAEADTRSVT